MRESMEIWKVLLLAVEMFAMGGCTFVKKGSKTHLVLAILTSILGSIFIMVA